MFKSPSHFVIFDAGVPDEITTGNFWVASTGEIVVGTIALLDIGNHCGALRKMFVKANYRGK